MRQARVRDVFAAPFTRGLLPLTLSGGRRLVTPLAPQFADETRADQSIVGVVIGGGIQVVEVTQVDDLFADGGESFYARG